MEAEAYHEEMLKLTPGDPKIEEIRNKFYQKEKEPCNAVIKPDIVFFGEPLPSVSNGFKCQPLRVETSPKKIRNP